MKKLSKIEAIVDLRQVEGEVISLNKLKNRWGWKHHGRVLRLINELSQHQLIYKKSSKKGTQIFFTFSTSEKIAL